MEHIVPSLSLVKSVRRNMERGLSVLSALEAALNQQETNFSHKVSIWLSCYKSGSRNQIRLETVYQECFMEMIGLGLAGAPIYDHMLQLEKEMEEEFEKQWKAHLESLPSKITIPLLCLFFPAYLVLLFGPLLVQFLEGVKL